MTINSLLIRLKEYAWILLALAAWAYYEYMRQNKQTQAAPGDISAQLLGVKLELNNLKSIIKDSALTANLTRSEISAIANKLYEMDGDLNNSNLKLDKIQRDIDRIKDRLLL